jgi:hypothetical protein
MAAYRIGSCIKVCLELVLGERPCFRSPAPVTLFEIRPRQFSCRLHSAISLDHGNIDIGQVATRRRAFFPAESVSFTASGCFGIQTHGLLSPRILTTVGIKCKPEYSIWQLQNSVARRPSADELTAAATVTILLPFLNYQSLQSWGPLLCIETDQL